jgi:hypothetical protein
MKEILKRIAELIGDSISYSQFDWKVNKKFPQGKSTALAKQLHIKYLAEDGWFVCNLPMPYWRSEIPHRLRASLRFARGAGNCRLRG